MNVRGREGGRDGGRAGTHQIILGIVGINEVLHGDGPVFRKSIHHAINLRAGERRLGGGREEGREGGHM